MAKLPKSLIKKYGISKKAWAVFRGEKKRSKKTQVKHMARKRRYSKKSYSRKGKGKGFGMGGAVKILIGAAIAAAYEVFVSPMIPLSSTIKNIVELVVGVLLMSMRGMPMIVRAGGAALATVNAYQLIMPFFSGSGASLGSSGSSQTLSQGAYTW